MSSPRPLSQIVPAVARKALGKTGVHLATLLNHWSDIVGDNLALACSPEKLSFPRGRQDGAVLQVRISGSAALMLQHDEKVVLERINRIFGYRAVERLKYIQAPPRFPSPTHKPMSLPDLSVTARIEKITAEIEDETLRHALQQLGTAIGRSN